MFRSIKSYTFLPLPQLNLKVYGSPKSFRTQKILIAAKIANKDVNVVDQKPPHNKFPLGIKVYGSPKSFRTQKILIAAKIANKDVSVVDQKPPHNKFPLGITPALEDKNVTLFGSDAIMLHLAGESMKTANCAEVLQWLQWSEGQLLPNVLGYVLPSVSAASVDNQLLEASRTELFDQLKNLNGLLLTKTFLVGERMSLADISVAMDLLPAYQYVLDEKARTPLVNLNRWFKTIINQPAVKEDNVSETKPKEHHAKQKEPAHKEDKKGKANEVAEDVPDATDEVLAQEPKAVDPFASMPKG
ncbi:unnamed protein product [Gongylonema pulchrum]|uniref:eEF-1B gamma n=1 Tax=Gongylonema pulchrum TaxID=637853 RepID=A0A183E0H0_9BILA|nr:unnamed protein product [Gongylonema pulchrum]